MRTELGKIQKATCGFGGYQDAQFGVGFTLGGNAWGVQDFRGGWGMEPSSHANWTAAENNLVISDVFIWLRDILKAAGKTDISQLPGTPIEATFDGLKLSSWRILKEVL